MRNPLSQTRLEFTRDRIQHYSLETHTCDSCDRRYEPAVHSQPYVVQFGAIAVGLLLYAAFRLHGPPWLLGVLAAVSTVSLVAYRMKNRRAAAEGEKLRYGQLILRCPHCGHDGATRSAAAPPAPEGAEDKRPDAS